MITVLALVTGFVGMALFAVLVIRIREVSDAVSLKRHRRKLAGVADLLNYAAVVGPGVIANKNGSLMAAWLYRGNDLASSTDDELNRASDLVNASLAPLGDGWMIHIDAVRRPTANYFARGTSHFPDWLSAAMDAERRRFFERRGLTYEGHFVLTVTWFPPLLAQSKFTELMFEDDAKPNSPRAHYASLLERFSREIETLENRLGSVFKLQRLQAEAFETENGDPVTYDPFLSHLQFCVTGIQQPMVLPATPTHLDALLGGQELFGGVVPKIGRNFIQVVAIEGFPTESYPGILSILSDLDVTYRWSTRFIFLDQQTALFDMKKYERKWRQKQRGIIDVVFQMHNKPLDADAVAMTDDANQAMAELKGGDVSAGYYTSTLVLMGPDRLLLEEDSRKVQKAIFDLGFACRIETINAMDAWLGSLPGHGAENVRRPIMHTGNLADLIPLSSTWTGREHAPCPFYPPNSPALMYTVTTGRSPFRLNLHVRDLGHTVIFGPTGSGKSTALGALVSQALRYENMSVFVFDKGLSMYVLTRALGGRHYTIGVDKSQLNFCPLQNVDSETERAWATDWLDTLLSLNNLETTPRQRKELSRVLESMAGSGTRTFTEFCTLVQDESIREALYPYTRDGSMGELFEAEQDALQLNSRGGFVTFEMEEIIGRGDRFRLPLMLYLFHCIERSLRGQPAMIVIDEAWAMLEHPLMRERIEKWLREMRKRNCMVILATQSLSDAVNSSISGVIMESTASKICLANVHARNPDATESYRKCGLNAQQIEIIASATPKRDYYLISESGCRLFSFALQPLMLAFVGASDRETVEKVRQMEAVYGDKWTEEYLRDKKLLEQAHEYGQESFQ